MLQHILMWNWKESAPEAERAAIVAEFRALVGRVPTLKDLKIGPVVGGRNQSFDYCFVMLFDDAQGLAEYQTHPDHVRVSARFREAWESQVAVDFTD